MIGHLANDQVFIRKLTEITLANLGDGKFDVKELAQESGMSHRSLNRRQRAITSKTVNRFIRDIGLHKALEMLQNETLTVSEVAYKVGFSRAAYWDKGNLYFWESD